VLVDILSCLAGLLCVLLCCIGDATTNVASMAIIIKLINPLLLIPTLLSLYMLVLGARRPRCETCLPPRVLWHFIQNASSGSHAQRNAHSQRSSIEQRNSRAVCGAQTDDDCNI